MEPRWRSVTAKLREGPNLLGRGTRPNKGDKAFRLRGSDMTQGDARTARCAVLARLELRNSLAHRSVFKKKEEERILNMMNFDRIADEYAKRTNQFFIKNK